LSILFNKDKYLAINFKKTNLFKNLCFGNLYKIEEISLFLKPGIEEKKYLFLEKKNND